MGKTDYENQPNYILNALDEGFDVEIDVWVKNGLLFLGHDFAEFPIFLDFLKNDKLWCHAKNYEALDFLMKNNIHCFWHENDKFTITSKGYIWQYPSDITYENSIFLMPEIFDKNIDLKNIKGICSDYIQRFK